MPDARLTSAPVRPQQRLPNVCQQRLPNACQQRLPDAYFESMYARACDPWNLATGWYERRKFTLILAMLPYQRYRHAFERREPADNVTAMPTWPQVVLTVDRVIPAPTEAVWNLMTDRIERFLER